MFEAQLNKSNTLITMHSNQRLAKLKRSPVDFHLLTLNKLQISWES